jgi:serine O-acetyltransferase
VVGIPARPPKGSACDLGGIGYGLGSLDEDPVGEQLAALRAEIVALREEIAQMKAGPAEAGKPETAHCDGF